MSERIKQRLKAVQANPLPQRVQGRQIVPNTGAQVAALILENKELREAKAELLMALSWAMDVIDIYDQSLVCEFGEPADKVYSNLHLAGKGIARAAIAKHGGTP
jgi:hypothetical protein